MKQLILVTAAAVATLIAAGFYLTSPSYQLKVWTRLIGQ